LAASDVQDVGSFRYRDEQAVTVYSQGPTGLAIRWIGGGADAGPLLRRTGASRSRLSAAAGNTRSACACHQLGGRFRELDAGQQELCIVGPMAAHA
jgi:hypothetical protein